VAAKPPNGGEITAAPRRIEEVRRYVNEAYSEIPKELASLFSGTLDQLTDLQFTVSQSLATYISAPDDPNLPGTISSAVKSAQKISLTAIRELVDYMRENATFMADHDVPKLQVETTELVLLKREIDERFETAIKLHENDDPRALKPMLQAARDYKKYIDQANAKKAGSQAVTKREKHRQILVYVGAIVALVSLVLGIINLYINLRGKQ
jgi:hypothetical protein